MAILGAHMSIAGGHHKSVELAREFGCDCVQLFTKNTNQWKCKEILPEQAELFKSAVREHKIKHPIAHDSYLINLASPDETLWRRSIEAFRIELERCEQLGIAYLVTHPGAHCGAGEDEGLKRVIEALDEVHRQTPNLSVQTLLETTAGQGSCLGWRFEHLATILDGVRDPDRVAVCVDTCHVFAAGYPLSAPADYRKTMKELNTVIGLKQVKAFHLNDSKRELGSRVDRHAKIGGGHLGLDAFRNLLNDSRFRRTPMYLETPKGMEDGEHLDRINLATLRSLVEA